MRKKSFFLLKIILALYLLLSRDMEAAIQVTLGPEIFAMERTRTGGAFQNGVMDGARLIVERLRPWGIYAAFDVFYGEGKFQGRNKVGKTLYSEITDTIAEARVGYCLQNPEATSLLTPFIGYGYFREKNAFEAPSPLPFTFVDSFNYFLFGFLSSRNFTPLLSMGFNFELKCMQKGSCQISNNPNSSNITLNMNNEFQVRVEIPWTLRFSTQSAFSLELTPFYEFRHFGGCEAFPYNYIDTKFQLLGARTAIKYRF